MKSLDRNLFSKWLMGERDAIEFNSLLYGIAETWDDLIDKDVTVREAAVNAAFFSALISLPRNRFYQQNFSRLSPVMESAIFDWRTANMMEKRKSGSDIHSAYILRCGLQAVTVMCASIIGGHEWAQSVNDELRSLGDTWGEYAKGFGEA